MARKIDTVTVEVVRNLLMSIAEETYGIIVRSAYSTNMKERRDVCTAVIDPDGNSVAQVESLAALLGSMLNVVPNIYAKYGKENIKPGDMFIANDPYHGGGNHLPDICLAAPVFAGDKLIAWIANNGHHSDIGGKVPGSTSGDADSLFQEGIRIPVIRIRENDKLIQSVMDLSLDNTRVPQEREGDLTAPPDQDSCRLCVTRKRLGPLLRDDARKDVLQRDEKLRRLRQHGLRGLEL